ncbi:MAG: MlaA family lipoprotein [Gammaproteobacteria bacterium]
MGRIRNTFIIFVCCLVVITTGLTGCVTYNKDGTRNIDPYEKYNRAMFQFNMKVDDYIMYPVAKTYTTICPWPVRKGVANFFNNFHQITVIANDLLQIDIPQTLSDVWRFFFNTTFGIAGLFDVATPLGLEQHNNDFGVTLGKWGYEESNYLMVPFLGPATVRDGCSWMVDYYLLSPWLYIEPWKLRMGMLALDTVSLRANLLGTEKVVKDAFDPYIFMRNAYLQRRSTLIAGKHVNDNPYATTEHANVIEHRKVTTPETEKNRKNDEDWALSSNHISSKVLGPTKNTAPNTEIL